MRGLLPAVAVLTLGACGILQPETPPPPTLADLQPIALPDREQAVPEISLQELAAIYREVLLVTDDTETRVQVLERLAGLDILQAEAALADTGDGNALFQMAIEAYRQLLLQQPGASANDRLLYQLAKAYDMTGEPGQALATMEQLAAGFPQSPHRTEAEFRIGEHYFSEANYPAAERAYDAVIAAGPDSNFYLNALYMHGWAQFKQGKYRQCIASYTATLDALLPAANEMATVTAADRALIDDSMRVLAVVFSTLEGAETIAAAYQRLGPRHYEPLIYEALGELYLEQERYRDSAETFRAFSRRYPNSGYAHRFHVRVIGIYEAAGFSDLIVQEKRDYVANYTIAGDYYRASTTAVQSEIRDKLGLYIVELATHFHALAQAQEPGAQGRAHYRLAGDYYRQYIESFPGDPRLPELGFLLAETRTESGNDAEAIAVFEWVAYDYPDYPQAADAGYAAILGYAPLLESAATGSIPSLRAQRVDSQLRFAARFPADERRPAVLNDAAARLLDQQDYRLAIIAAAALVNHQPQPAPSLLVPGWLVISHSYFELADYTEASAGYRRALARMDSGDPRRDSAVNRLAASLYREAEQVAASGDPIAAARAFKRVIEETPDTGFRRQAQFDAAQYFMNAGAYSEANTLLRDFQQRFPGDDLAREVPLKLVYSLEQLQDWDAAAIELDRILETEADATRAREILYLAASHYWRAGNSGRAIDHFRRYAHTFEQPLAPRMEAMESLTGLYAERQDNTRRNFWLRKLMAAHDAAAQDQTDRSLFLAAWASTELANQAYERFTAVKLQHPLKTSLKKKQAAMEEALEAYQVSNRYAVAEFASLATYRMGEIYRQLGTDLMASERPAGLDALALEQYELLLEEQAYPFEEKAIAIHETNMQRSWEGWYDDWIRASFEALARLSPARYAKAETSLRYSEEIF